MLSEFRLPELFLLLIFVFDALAGLVTFVPDPLDPGLVAAGLVAGRD